MPQVYDWLSLPVTSTWAHSLSACPYNDSFWRKDGGQEGLTSDHSNHHSELGKQTGPRTLVMQQRLQQPIGALRRNKHPRSLHLMPNLIHSGVGEPKSDEDAGPSLTTKPSLPRRERASDPKAIACTRNPLPPHHPPCFLPFSLASPCLHGPHG